MLFHICLSEETCRIDFLGIVFAVIQMTTYSHSQGIQTAKENKITGFTLKMQLSIARTIQSNIGMRYLKKKKSIFMQIGFIVLS